ncbi:hypothetical protein CVT26_013159, partial [Gymnopilus dilepis]
MTLTLVSVTRLLYAKRSILHRDISSGNVMVPVNVYNDECAEDLGFCGISHLRNPKDSQTATSVLLIDFDCGQNMLAENDPSGTPRFIARAVSSGGPVKPPSQLPYVHFMPIPQLRGKSGGMYERKFPDRVNAFQNAKQAETVKAVSEAKWRHSLYHDAESAFWLLVWWLVNAIPEHETKPKRMNLAMWVAMLGDPRERRVVISEPEFIYEAVHPSYKPLRD